MSYHLLRIMEGILLEAKKELAKPIKEWNNNKITEAMLHREIDWKFNMPYSSHFGGCWERQIRTIRKLFTSV